MKNNIPTEEVKKVAEDYIKKEGISFPKKRLETKKQYGNRYNRFLCQIAEVIKSMETYDNIQACILKGNEEIALWAKKFNTRSVSVNFNSSARTLDPYLWQLMLKEIIEVANILANNREMLRKQIIERIFKDAINNLPKEKNIVIIQSKSYVPTKEEISAFDKAVNKLQEKGTGFKSFTLWNNECILLIPEVNINEDIYRLRKSFTGDPVDIKITYK